MCELGCVLVVLLLLSSVVLHCHHNLHLIRVINIIHASRITKDYLATFKVDSRSTIILDIRLPSIPVTELGGHAGCVNAVAWAPHSSCHVCTAGDDNQALIWDLSQMSKRPVEDPILAYNAEGEVNNLQWSSSQPDWVGIAFSDKLQILRV